MCGFLVSMDTGMGMDTSMGMDTGMGCEMYGFLSWQVLAGTG